MQLRIRMNIGDYIPEIIKVVYYRTFEILLEERACAAFLFFNCLRVTDEEVSERLTGGGVPGNWLEIWSRIIRVRQ